MMTPEQAIASLQRQKALLLQEYEAEKDAFHLLTEQVGMERKVKRGDAWYPIKTGKVYYNSMNQKVMEVFRQHDLEIEHNFEYGRPVMFFTIDGEDTGKNKISYFKFTGTVSYAENERMVVTVPDDERFSAIQKSRFPVGVQLSFDESSYRLMFEALDRVIRAKDNRLSYLRNLFYSNQKAEHFKFANTAFPWLNQAQATAVNEILRAKDVMVVHGPPGTGKTTTLVEAIYESLHRESQVMVCAQSNMAVDWISEKLVDRGVNVLRIGNPTRVNDKMLAFTYERRFEGHPLYPELWAARKTIREIRRLKGKHNEKYHQKLERLKSRATEMEIKINNELFGEARVIASTLTGAASRTMSGQKFGSLFIDEAAQALEAACWIAIRRASRVILAGDHCQLPPVLKSMEAAKGGLGKTLMERIAENKPEVVTMLDVQYRMNEQIMKFSSNWFYDGKLKSAPEIKYRGILDYDEPMVWVETDCESMEAFITSSFGRINKKEAELALNTLEQYFTKIGKNRILEESIDVGIISPYRAQVQYLRQQLRKKAFFKPYRHLICVNTVDGFQGQERDVILISMVRSNTTGEIGFLRDLRRMNVAITRARMKLFIMGNAETLCKHLFYKKLHDHCHHYPAENAIPEERTEKADETEKNNSGNSTLSS